MAQIEVRIFREGRQIDQVVRPLRHVDEQPVIKYKRRFWQLINGGEVYLDDIAPVEDARMAGSAETVEPGTVHQHPLVGAAAIEWNATQREIIDASSNARVLVGRAQERAKRQSPARECRG